LHADIAKSRIDRAFRHGYPSRMKNQRSEWWVPAGLIVLSLVPVGAGVVRLGQLSAGAATAENARYFASPVPIVLHIVSVTLFSLLGAAQFAPSLRRRGWHKNLGRIVVPAGLVAAASGLWMSQLSALPPIQGRALYLTRLAVGVWMMLSLVQGTLAIRRREVQRHQDWMLRGYAVGMGAGTQVLTNLPWVLLFGTPDAPTYAVLMGAGWAINVVVAEVIIRRRAAPVTSIAAQIARATRGPAETLPGDSRMRGV
jgi:uncharacterized membrane protein